MATTCDLVLATHGPPPTSHYPPSLRRLPRATCLPPSDVPFFRRRHCRLGAARYRTTGALLSKRRLAQCAWPRSSLTTLDTHSLTLGSTPVLLLSHSHARASLSLSAPSRRRTRLAACARGRRSAAPHAHASPHPRHCPPCILPTVRAAPAATPHSPSSAPPHLTSCGGCSKSLTCSPSSPSASPGASSSLSTMGSRPTLRWRSSRYVSSRRTLATVTTGPSGARVEGRPERCLPEAAAYRVVAPRTRLAT